MRLWRTWLGVLACLGSTQLACTPSDGKSSGAWEQDESSSVTSMPAEGLEVAPALVLNDDGGVRPTPPPAPVPGFQPGFHQALRGNFTVGGVTTFRLRIPIARAGERLQVTFRAGDGSLTLERASVARAGPDGTLLSAPVPLAFGGKPGFTSGPRTLVASDPVVFPVKFREELAITFEARGALAASTINAFPGSTIRPGTHAMSSGTLSGETFERSVGVATVAVEGPPGRVFLAVGDSITEGYVDERNDARNAWPALVESQLGVPVVNAGVSGQGFYDALMRLDGEVLAVKGVTDCLVLLGTNDLGEAGAEEQMEGRMRLLVQRLEPFCRVWVSTLLPKEKTNYGSYDLVKSQRLEFNAWLRAGGAGAGIIDLEAVTRRPTNVHLYLPGLTADGIHPTTEGHRVIATEVARVLRERGAL
ncbi:GDSL-like lipase/acylhydrolase family protein [Myxococcus stipitatus DSM 14675]|uniref:GDSL-like lipase/acylhydrolase family protein n=1 Tax=Myxococcus stipitatus (strain DSM 14675 / JCM 12634 / Mx s8) TaxID=1278073 RepID=L7UFE2_MYXSD|nr:GDSL-type esterase/lipase family protein [Myxococcus stipitatus]AGC46312.1 GDSL-like lipase/acylhydrolase family protein [Myxococcus stipitatus DSM 14675]